MQVILDKINILNMTEKCNKKLEATVVNYFSLTQSKIMNMHLKFLHSTLTFIAVSVVIYKVI